MMGLYDTAYWFSWLSWEGIITLLSSLFTVIFGIIFQLDFFTRNSFAVAFVLFFLFQLNMVGLFLESYWLHSSKYYRKYARSMPISFLASISPYEIFTVHLECLTEIKDSSDKWLLRFCSTHTHIGFFKKLYSYTLVKHFKM